MLACEDAPSFHRCPFPRKMRVSPLMALVALCVTGCGSSTGIMPVGPDTYAISEMRAPVLGGGDEAQYSPPNPAFRTWNNCPPLYTVQDGLCKPYKGR